MGRRIERNAVTYPSTTSTTRYIYDGSDVIRDTDANGVTTADYLNGPGIDNKIRQTANGTSLYFLTDQLGSTNSLTAGIGNVIEQQQYDSFGNSSGSTLTRYDYTGRERDPQTGLMFYRARWYDPQAGRFISEDPIWFGGQDVNLYGYVRNNPVRYVDPNGTNPLLPLVGVIAVETILHEYLTTRADRFYSNDRDKHCYVNCMSNRIHGLNPVWPTIASGAQEVGGLVFGVMHGTLKETAKDSAGDLAADFHGQAAAAVFWRSCQKLCASCPWNFMTFPTCKSFSGAQQGAVRPAPIQSGDRSPHSKGLSV